MKKLLAFGALLVLSVGLAACSDTESVSASELYVSIDINPSIEFIVDEDGLVESYRLLNDDAQLLCVDVNFVGMTIDDATELFVSMATEAGFIDVDSEDNAVLITVYGENQEYSNMIREQLKERLVRYLARNYINGVVLDEGYTSEEVEATALELGITPAKLKLIYAAQASNPELTIEQGIETSIKELLGQIRANHDEEINNMTDDELAELRLQRDQLIVEYRARLEAHILANPVLTEEQLNVRVNELLRETHPERYENWENLRETYEQRITEARADLVERLLDDEATE
ncbi:MAG: hypothetical protein QM489_07410 [Candidatus Izemoplasma sp.]